MISHLGLIRTFPKVLNIKPEEINKALVLGLLSKINELDEEEKRDFTRIGMDILQQWKS
ncbi:hypothetical protein ACQZ6X_004884 [Escherichia coli]